MRVVREDEEGMEGRMGSGKGVSIEGGVGRGEIVGIEEGVGRGMGKDGRWNWEGETGTAGRRSGKGEGGWERIA